jgi:mycothiol system anti-sigma-R factor
VPCEFSQNQLHGYLDGELDAVSASEFEKHLGSCPECQRLLAVDESLRKAMRDSMLYERAPRTLRENLFGHSTQQVSMQSPAVRSASWRWLAAAAALVLAVFLGWRQIGHPSGPSATQLAVAALVDAHLRSLQPGHLADVESSDQHTVKPWFDGRLDFAPPVPDFSGDGFPLLGGRLDVVQGRTVAALVYGRRKHIINVFVEKASPVIAWTGSGSTQGYQWIAWQKDAFTLCAVSDVSSADLNTLKDLFLAQ